MLITHYLLHAVIGMCSTLNTVTIIFILFLKCKQTFQ